MGLQLPAVGSFFRLGRLDAQQNSKSTPLDVFVTHTPRSTRAQPMALAPPQKVPAYEPYLAPNETRPQCMRTVTREAPPGAYVGVGTERCWLAAALHPQLTLVAMVDRDPRVVFYNRVNLALMHASRGDRRRYVALRTATSPEAWTAAAADVPGAKLLLQPAAFAWWRDMVVHNGEHFARLIWPSSSEDMQRGNYVVDDALFAQLYEHVCADKIRMMPADFTSAGDVQALAQRLRKSGHMLSVLDVSNAWWPDYIGAARLRKVVQALQPLVTSRSLLMGTQASSYVAGGPCFGYFATHAEDLLTGVGWDAFQTFARWLDRRRGRIALENLEKVDAHRDWILGNAPRAA